MSKFRVPDPFLFGLHPLLKVAVGNAATTLGNDVLSGANRMISANQSFNNRMANRLSKPMTPIGSKPIGMSANNNMPETTGQPQQQQNQFNLSGSNYDNMEKLTQFPKTKSQAPATPAAKTTPPSKPAPNQTPVQAAQNPMPTSPTSGQGMIPEIKAPAQPTRWPGTPTTAPNPAPLPKPAPNQTPVQADQVPITTPTSSNSPAGDKDVGVLTPVSTNQSSGTPLTPGGSRNVGTNTPSSSTPAPESNSPDSTGSIASPKQSGNPAVDTNYTSIASPKQPWNPTVGDIYAEEFSGPVGKTPRPNGGAASMAVTKAPPTPEQWANRPQETPLIKTQLPALTRTEDPFGTINTGNVGQMESIPDTATMGYLTGIPGRRFDWRTEPIHPATLDNPNGFTPKKFWSSRANKFGSLPKYALYRLLRKT